MVTQCALDSTALLLLLLQCGQQANGSLFLAQLQDLTCHEVAIEIASNVHSHVYTGQAVNGLR